MATHQPLFLIWSPGLKQNVLRPGVEVFTWPQHQSVFNPQVFANRDRLELESDDVLRRMVITHPESARRIRGIIQDTQKPLSGLRFFVLEHPSGGHVLLKPSIHTSDNRRSLAEFLISKRWHELAPEHATEPIGLAYLYTQPYLGYRFEHDFVPLDEYRDSLTHSATGAISPEGRRLLLATLTGMALGKAHNSGLAHGDLIPKNILVRAGPDHVPTEVKLIDWEWSVPRGFKTQWQRLDAELRSLWSKFKQKPTDSETLAFLRAYDGITSRRLASAYNRFKNRHSDDVGR